MPIHGDIGHLHWDKKARKKQQLGRHIHHDPRSKDHPVVFSEEHKAAELVSKVWTREIPILNQGQLGSCTANAATGLLGTAPYHEACKTAGLTLDEPFAVQLYTDETKIDGIRGEWPPDDTGSTGLASMKTLHKRGIIVAYKHCFGLDDVLRHLAFLGPVSIGIAWKAKMNTPSKAGVVRFSGKVEGGHQFLLRGIDVDKNLVLADNSWGARWGIKGSFYIPFDDLHLALKDSGDAVTIVLPTG